MRWDAARRKERGRTIVLTSFGSSEHALRLLDHALELLHVDLAHRSTLVTLALKAPRIPLQICTCISFHPHRQGLKRTRHPPHATAPLLRACKRLPRIHPPPIIPRSLLQFTMLTLTLERVPLTQLLPPHPPRHAQIDIRRQDLVALLDRQVRYDAKVLGRGRGRPRGEDDDGVGGAGVVEEGSEG